MINSGFTIKHNLDSGEITAKFSVYEIELPKRHELVGADLEDLSVSLLSEAISDYAFAGGPDKTPERLQQGFKACRQLKAWLEQYRNSDPNICAECTQRM